MGFPEHRPRASGGYQDDATIPDNGGYRDDLSPADFSGSAGDLADQYEETADENTVGEDDYDDEEYDESDEFDILGGDEFYGEGTGYDPAGFPRQAGRDNGRDNGHAGGLMG
jgi:hypothetical protein